MFRYSLFIAFFMLYGCVSPHSAGASQYVIDGEIDTNVVNGVYGALGAQPGTLIVTSEGGRASAALALSYSVNLYGHEIVIKDYCLSSCAEFLLMSSPSISAVDLPVVGFHGSPGLDLIVAKSIFPSGNLSCIETLVAKQREVVNSGIEIDQIWIDQRDKLKPSHPKMGSVTQGDNYSCAHVRYELEKDFWFPSSEYFESVGIVIKGALCADVPGCLERKVPALLGATTTYTK